MSLWLHPGVVHFAVALVLAGVLLDVVALWRASERLLFAGYWNTLLGAAALAVAVATGALAEANLGAHNGLGDALLALHRATAYAALILALALATARLAMRGRIRPKTRTLYLAAAFTTSALIIISATLGGVLVYRFGLGIPPDAARAVIAAQRKPLETANTAQKR